MQQCVRRVWLANVFQQSYSWLFNSPQLLTETPNIPASHCSHCLSFVCPSLYLVGVMIVPRHVVFLWRIIHQHFTLAFLEHISTCRWNKPSWIFRKSCLLWPKKYLNLNCLGFFLERSQRRTTEARSALFLNWCSRKSRRFTQKQIVHSERCQDLEGSSFLSFLFFFFFLMTLTIS